VIHTVGPVGEKPDLLQTCCQTTLDLCIKYGIKSIALCCVSTGIYGYPLSNATRVTLQTVRKWLEIDSNRKEIDRIIFAMFTVREKDCYQKLLPIYFPLQESTDNQNSPTQSLSSSSESTAIRPTQPETIFSDSIHEIKEKEIAHHQKEDEKETVSQIDEKEILHPKDDEKEIVHQKEEEKEIIHPKEDEKEKEITHQDEKETVHQKEDETEKEIAHQHEKETAHQKEDETEIVHQDEKVIVHQKEDEKEIVHQKEDEKRKRNCSSR